MKQTGYISRRPLWEPLLSSKNRKVGLQSTQAQQSWQMEEWKNVACLMSLDFCCSIQMVQSEFCFTEFCFCFYQASHICHCLIKYHYLSCPSLYGHGVPYSVGCYHLVNSAYTKLRSNWFLEHEHEFTVLEWLPQSIINIISNFFLNLPSPQ